MLKKEEVLLLTYLIGVIFFLVLFVVVFFIAFQRRKNKLLEERYLADQRFQKELANSQIEIQEQVLKNIAWELHDNVGQLLSVANMQLNVLLNTAAKESHTQILETKGIIKESVQEIRSLSKVLNNDVVLKNGLIASLKVELDRFNRLGYLNATLEIQGDIIPINSANEIIIFRIIQEFLNNVLKHARASKLFVLLAYKETALDIVVEDNGVGFDTSSTTTSSGMETIKGRAKLINAKYSIASQIGKGTKLFLSYSYNSKK